MLLEDALGYVPQFFSGWYQLIGVCFGAAASTGTVNPAEVAILQVAGKSWVYPMKICLGIFRHC